MGKESQVLSRISIFQLLHAQFGAVYFGDCKKSLVFENRIFLSKKSRKNHAAPKSGKRGSTEELTCTLFLTVKLMESKLLK